MLMGKILDKGEEVDIKTYMYQGVVRELEKQ